MHYSEIKASMSPRLLNWSFRVDGHVISLTLPHAIPGVAWVDSLLLLGIVLDHHLLFTPHVTKTLAQGAQSAYALKVLKFHGLSMESLDTVCMATLVARVLHASPCLLLGCYLCCTPRAAM